MTTRRVLPLVVLITAGLCFAGQDDAEPAPKPAVVKFEMLPSNHMVVQTKVNGKGPYRLVFDLGAPITLLGNKTAVDSGAVPKDAPKSLLFAMRGEGKAETIEAGELTAKDLPVVVMDHPLLKALGDLHRKPLHGILGYTFFARYRTSIDYQKKEMTFTPVEFEVRDLMKDLPDRMMGRKVARTTVLAPRGLWGLKLDEPSDGRGVRIESVGEGSPAEAAGLKSGDVVTSIDGRWTVSVPDVYAAAATVEPGRSVSVVVERDGEERTVTVTPREGI